MSDPYRSPGGTPCPRCESPLAREREDELVCANGCGAWLGNARIPLDPARLVGASRGNPFRATALPFTRCLVCKRSLNDLYMGDHDVLVVGQCLEHGIWIERADRATFEARYAGAIFHYLADQEHAEAERLRVERERERELLAQELVLSSKEHEQELASMPSVVKALVRRVSLLERQVQDLKRELAKLS